MWTRENRGLYERKGVRYPSDLRDEEWALIAPLIPPAKRGGRRREVDVREVTHRALASCLLSGFVWASKVISARGHGHGDTPIPVGTFGEKKLLVDTIC